MTPARPAASPARRRWRFLMMVLGLLVVAGAAFVAFLAYREYANDRLLREAIAEVEATDPHWRIEAIEAGRAVVPDAENSATIIRQARALVGNPNLTAIGRWDYVQLPPEIRLTETQYHDVTATLAAAGPGVDAALAVADYPRGRYPIAYATDGISTARGYDGDMWFAHSFTLRPLLLSRIHADDGAGALVVCRAVLNFGRSLGDEPLLNSQLSRQQLHKEAVRGLKRILGQCEVPEADLAVFQAALAEETEYDAWETIWRGARAIMLPTLEAVRHGQLKPRTINGMRPASTVLGQVQEWYRDHFPLDTRPAAAAGLRHFSRLLEAGKLPWPQRRAVVQAIAADLAGAPAPARDFLYPGPHLATACQSTLAYGRCAVAMIAVERYRLRRGAWPESLAALVPDLLPAVPLDPFDGQPLRYRKLADGIVIYSVGDDGKDDGGQLNDGNMPSPGTDLGVRLWDVPKRRQPPPGGGSDCGEPGA